MPEPSARIDGLEALRAVAAFLVVFDHTLLMLIDNGQLPEALASLAYQLGSVGVAIFFALSGYVMSLTAGSGQGGTRAAGRFLLRRLTRIAPLYWLVTLIYVLRLAIDGRPPSPEALLQSLLFVPHLDAAGQLRPVLGVGWTLDVEMYFYLAFAAALLLPSALRLAGICAIFLATGATTFLSGATIADFFISPLLALFPIGMLIHALVEKGRGILFLCPVFSLCLLLSGIPPATCLSLAIAPLLVLTAVHFPRLTGPAARVILPLGQASFSIYLTHGFVLGPLGRVLENLSFVPPLAILLAFLLTAFAGVTVHLLIERPMLAAIRARLGKPRKMEGALAAR